MTSISLVLFDLNGVLYRYDRAARIARLASVSGQPQDKVKAAIWDSGFEDSGDEGALDAEAYLRGFGACLGHALTEDEWVAAQRAAVSPIADTLALLPNLRTRCAVLTNNNLLVRRWFETLYPEAAGCEAFVSAEFGARKPEPLAYLRCLDRLGVPPAEALFVDDSAANVAGARAAGLQGCVYAGPAELKTEFVRCGVWAE